MGLAEYRREKKAEAKAAAEAAAAAAALAASGAGDAAASSPGAATGGAAVDPAGPADPADALTSEAAALLAGLRRKLARYPGPAYRKAYLANLVESGKRYLIAENARAAAYCFDKVNEAATAALGPDAHRPDADAREDLDAENDSPAMDSDTQASPDAEAAAGEPSAPRPRNPRAARAPSKPKPLTPTDIFRRNWREARLKDAEQVLNRHGGRLSALENKAYKERLDKLRHTAETATGPGPQMDRVDAGLLELRRRLYGRVLKSQKIALKRSRMPMTLARLALPPAARGAQSMAPAAPANPTARPPARTGKAPAVQVDAAWQPAVGPYNDRYNMEDLLSLIAEADAAWVEEFLDLYRGLSGLQNLMVSISALKKT
jgi:hypothetical protein